MANYDQKELAYLTKILVIAENNLFQLVTSNTDKDHEYMPLVRDIDATIDNFLDAVAEVDDIEINI